jgi:hypothetical protein
VGIRRVSVRGCVTRGLRHALDIFGRDLGSRERTVSHIQIAGTKGLWQERCQADGRLPRQQDLDLAALCKLVQELAAMATGSCAHGDGFDAGLIVHEGVREGGLLGVHRLAEALPAKFEIRSRIKRARLAPDDRADAKVRQRWTRIGLRLREQLKHTWDVHAKDTEPG